MTAASALATALAALVRSDLDVADVLARLLADCAEATSSDAVAVLAQDGEHLSLLGATSHRAIEIEMLQGQQFVGPCAEAVTSGLPVAVAGAEEIVERWGAVGRAIVEAGFADVESYPLTWRDQTLGSLNLFRRTPGIEAGGFGQAFADMVTLVVVQSVVLTDAQVRGRMHEALVAREVVEQAKGVIAYVYEIDLEGAYAELLRRAADSDLSLTQVAEQTVRTRR